MSTTKALVAVPFPRAPYERYESETDAAWHAFQHYRDMRHERSIQAALEEHRSGCGQGETRARGNLADWERWSSQHEWGARCRAMSVDLDRHKLDAMRDEAIEMGRRHARSAADAIEALSVPARVVVERMRRDPELMERLLAVASDVEGMVAFLNLARTVGQALPPLAKMEREARGMREEDEADVTTVRIIMEVDEAFRA